MRTFSPDEKGWEESETASTVLVYFSIRRLSFASLQVDKEAWETLRRLSFLIDAVLRSNDKHCTRKKACNGTEH